MVVLYLLACPKESFVSSRDSYLQKKKKTIIQVNYDTAASRIAKNPTKIRTLRLSTLDALASFRYLQIKKLLFCLYTNMPCLLFAVAFNLKEATSLATV